MEEAVSAALGVIDSAVEQFNPAAIFGLFSGGHDSLTATHVASRHPAFRAAVHINTGIGVEDTREFVRQTCREQGWPLIELHPPVTYDELVLRFGFPGPAGHGLMYQRLKERCLRQLVREHKRHIRDKIGLITGIRREESQRRMGHNYQLHTVGAQLWIAAIYDWSKLDCGRYLTRHGVRRNEVVDHLHMSGECLCGAFARPDELEEISLWYPQTAARIRALEERAAREGVHAKWGKRPPRKQAAGQLDFGPLCVGCAERSNIDQMEDIAMPRSENFVPVKDLREALVKAYQALTYCQGYFEGRDIQAPEVLSEAIDAVRAARDAKTRPSREGVQLELAGAAPVQ